MHALGGVADDEDWLFDDDEVDAWLAEWEEADRQAAEVLRAACPTELASGAPRAELERAASELRERLAGGGWPFDYFLRACAWSEEDLPQGDLVLWISALASSISPPNDPGVDVEQASAVAALLHADWLGVVVGLVRRGVGAEFSAPAALRIERLRRIQERVLTADPGARLLDESSRPTDDLLSQDGSEETEVPSSGPGELDPEVIEQVVRQHEANWVDGPVPALHGHTPREAAQDPALRHELIALLDDFEWQSRRNPEPFGMDVGRLRRELGIGDERG